MKTLINWWWMLAGTVILIWPCLRQDWVETTSTENPFNRAPRTIDRWRSDWLQSIYGNPEDGVSGRYALIWVPGESKYGANDRVLVRVYYRPNTWTPLRAWIWSALRNSTDMLKYR